MMTPSWIQAIAAAVLVFLTWRSLLVLRGYAKDTKTIADKSVEQAENAQKQVAESQRQADAAMQSLNLLKGQIQGQQAQEIARALTALHAVDDDVKMWLAIIENNKWNVPLPASKFIPDDWPVVVFVGARVGLQKEMDSLGKSLGKIRFQLGQFLSQPVGHRDSYHINKVHPIIGEVSLELPRIIEQLHIRGTKSNDKASQSRDVE